MVYFNIFPELPIFFLYLYRSVVCSCDYSLLKTILIISSISMAICISATGDCEAVP